MPCDRRIFDSDLAHIRKFDDLAGRCGIMRASVLRRKGPAESCDSVLTGALLHMKITSASVPSAAPDRRWGIRMVSLCKKQVCRQELLISGRPASILERASQKPLRKFMGLQRVPFRRFSRMNFIFTLFSAHSPSCNSRMSTVLCIIVKR